MSDDDIEKPPPPGMVFSVVGGVTNLAVIKLSFDLARASFGGWFWASVLGLFGGLVSLAVLRAIHEHFAKARRDTEASTLGEEIRR
jgi:hypothetical protein